MIKIIFIAISFLIIPGAYNGFRDSILILLNTSQVFHSVLIGFLIAVLLYYLLLRRFHALNVFEHELTHAIVALLFFRRIDFFVASSDGGFVRYRGGFGGEVGNVLITLAPYYLPTFTLFFCLLRPVIAYDWLYYYDIIIGFTLGYHTTSTIDETIRNYTRRGFIPPGSDTVIFTDIGKTGLVTSAFVILALTLLLHGIAFFMLTGGYPAVGQYFTLVFQKGWAICLAVYFWVGALVSALYQAILAR